MRRGRAPPRSPRACRRRAGSGPAIGTSTTSSPPLVEQPPHALVAVQVGELAEHARARTRSGARGRRRSGRRRARASPRPASSAADGVRRHAGLVAEHQHEHVAARVDDAERRGDRGRAALAVGVVDDDLGAGQVDARAHLVGGAADRDDRLVERGTRARRRRRGRAACRRRTGSSCFGRPRRFEPPAPRTSPQTNCVSRERHAARSNAALQPSQQK